jgi:hypothetical protein
VLFFFVISCIAKDDEVRLGEKYSILSRFGMTVGRMKNEKRLDALRRMLPFLLAFPAEILLMYISKYRDVHAFRQLWDYSCPKIAFLVTGIFMLVYWLIISRMDREWRKTL